MTSSTWKLHHLITNSSFTPPTLEFFYGICTLGAPFTHRESQNGETDRGDKSFSCGHPVWGLAFGPRPPKSNATACPAKARSEGKNSLLLATGLENGVIKIWNVLTGEIFIFLWLLVLIGWIKWIFKSLVFFFSFPLGSAVFDLHGHEGVVRDLVFPQNGTLTLISSSRDKTLRIWDLAHKGIFQIFIKNTCEWQSQLSYF